jgi:hypothetical protein
MLRRLLVMSFTAVFVLTGIAVDPAPAETAPAPDLPALDSDPMTDTCPAEIECGNGYYCCAQAPKCCSGGYCCPDGYPYVCVDGERTRCVKTVEETYGCTFAGTCG